MALIDDFKARFPEHDTTEVDALFPVLESSWPIYYGLDYSVTTQEVILQLISHLFVVEAEMNQTMGGVTDEGDQFNLTKYGQTFWQLIKHDGGICAV